MNRRKPAALHGLKAESQVYLIYTAYRHNLRFCKTALQAVLSAKRFAKPFYFKIRKAQIVTVERITDKAAEFLRPEFPAGFCQTTAAEGQPRAGKTRFKILSRKADNIFADNMYLPRSPSNLY